MEVELKTSSLYVLDKNEFHNIPFVFVQHIWEKNQHDNLYDCLSKESFRCGASYIFLVLLKRMPRLLRVIWSYDDAFS